MITGFILVSSMLLQFSAALLALRLTLLTQRKAAWGLVAAAFFLMALRRSIAFIRFLHGDAPHAAALGDEIAELAISMLLFAGITWVSAILLTSMRSYTSLRDSEAKSQKLLRVSREIVATTELQKLYRSVIKTAQDLLRLDTSTLMVLNEAKDRLIIEDTIGFPESVIGTFSLVDGQGLSTYVLKNQIPDTVIDFNRETRFEIPELVFENNLTSALCVPMMVGDDVLGVLIGHTQERREFTRDELSIYQNIANQAAIAITNSLNLKAFEVSERKYRDLYDNAPDMYHSLDKDGIIIDCNDMEAKILGYDKKDIIGRPLTDFLTKESKKRFDKQFATLNEDNVQLDLEREFVRRDGTTFPASLNVSAEFDESGELIRTKTIARDITDRVRMEQELLKAQKLESLGILAGGLAHDFNNLLAAILGNINLAKLTGTADRKIVDRLEEAEKASLRARDLTQQLLTFSKGGAPVRKPVDIGEIIKDASSFALRGSNVRCEFDIPEDFSTVEVDVGQMSQVMNNLVINADQAMPQGGILRITGENTTIGVKRSSSMKPGRYVKIAIEDEGVGIPESSLSRIFDPYFTTKQKGSGLGLATAYSIIDKHEGYIDVESVIGSGTKFHLYLPASRKKVRPAKNDNGEIHSGKGKILVMDDEDAVRAVIGEILKALGYTVEYAMDGSQAVELYEEAKQRSLPFDAVIMDLTVPGGMGGREAIVNLHKIDPEVRAIVASGFSNDPVMSEYKKYGFRGVVMKPCKIEELSSALHTVLAK